MSCPDPRAIENARARRWPAAVGVAARVAAVTAALVLLGACGGASKGAAPPPDDPAADSAEPSPQSIDILAREPVSNRVKVRHILIGWRDLGDAYQGGIDPRAAERDRAEAAAVVEQLRERLNAGEDFQALMREFSEDQGSAQSGIEIEVTPDAPLVLDFKRLSLRLQVGEFGVVETDFGWHIIKRTS